jgi:uncharacterized protein (TIGR02594 family)
VGIKEIPGSKDNPQVVAMLRLDQSGDLKDEVPWRSAFVNYVAWLLRLPRSKSLAARSWLQIGSVVNLNEAEVGFDVVIFKRGEGEQPGPEVVNAPGHVGFYAGKEGTDILVLGGNQGDRVSIARFAADKVPGIRRLV